MYGRSTLVKQHKWYSIYIIEKSGMFFARAASDGQTSKEFSEMKKAVDYIDACVKKVFKRFSAFAKTGGRWSNEQTWSNVEVTSLDFRNQWRVKIGKDNEIVYGDIYLFTKENADTIEALKAKTAQRKELSEEIEALEKKLKPVNKEDYRPKEKSEE